MSSSIALVIPARLGSTRLPRKVLLPWHNEAIIAHVAKRVLATNLGPVFVACDSSEIKDALNHLDVKCILTDPNLASGTDRVHGAIKSLEPQKTFDIIVNIQGDMPNVSKEMILGALEATRHAPIGTVAAPFKDPADMHSPAVVKIALTKEGRALYFSRSGIPHGSLTGLHHIGIYAFHRQALETFVSLPQSPLELQERLEQLRALEAGISIHVSHVEGYPISIDTPEDYARLLNMPAE